MELVGKCVGKVINKRESVVAKRVGYLEQNKLAKVISNVK